MQDEVKFDKENLYLVMMMIVENYLMLGLNYQLEIKKKRFFFFKSNNQTYEFEEYV